MESPADPTPAPRPATPGAGRSHLTTDFRFTAPANWDDRSVLMLTAPSDEGAPPPFAVTVHRDTPQDGEDLVTYVARQLDALRQSIPDLTVFREGTREVGGLPALDVEFAWMSDGGRRRQHQVHVLRGGRVLTWTATAPAELYINHVAQFAALLASVRFVGPSRVLPAPAAPAVPVA